MSRDAGRPPRFIEDDRLAMLLFGGKGGVGKTTSACAAAVRLAMDRPQTSVTLISTDPAHSTSDCLGDTDDLPENLELVELDSAAEQAAFISEHADQLREIALRGTFFDEEDVDTFLELAVPGADELMAFLTLAHHAERIENSPGEPRVVVVDTAPTGHTLRLLAMPDLVDRWLGALDALLAKHRFMASAFGSTGVDEVELFLARVTGQAECFGRLLRDGSRCQFVPVFTPESLAVAETNRLVTELERLGVACDEAVLNRLVPSGEGDLGEAIRAAQHRQLSALDDSVLCLDIWGLPVAPSEPVGRAALASLWDPGLAPGGITAWLASDVEHEPAEAPRVMQGRALSLDPKRRLLLVAGKGGVGKTTVACAAAMALAAARKKGDVLVVSTDPAHSVGDCYGVSLTGEPIEIVPRLRAMEIDAEAEFDRFREQYEQEIDAALGSLIEGGDLTFDREAMSRLVDLAPPGIDELMALVRIIDELDGVVGRTIVFDTAPTGHLLRLLETPELVESWLAGVFKLMLKYESVVRVPRLRDRLIELSKGIKSVRTMLGTAKSSSLVAVSIPTRLAVEELSDLALAIRSMGVALAGVVINRCTPDGGGVILSGQAEAERHWIEVARRAVPDAAPICLTWGGEPVGIERLGALGRELFAVHRGGLLSSAA
ncbi:MAG: ArsA family ATPase [Planctomycetota bacterium]